MWTISPAKEDSRRGYDQIQVLPGVLRWSLLLSCGVPRPWFAVWMEIGNLRVRHVCNRIAASDACRSCVGNNFRLGRERKAANRISLGLIRFVIWLTPSFLNSRKCHKVTDSVQPLLYWDNSCYACVVNGTSHREEKNPAACLCLESTVCCLCAFHASRWLMRDERALAMDPTEIRVERYGKYSIVDILGVMDFAKNVHKGESSALGIPRAKCPKFSPADTRDKLHRYCTYA